MSAGLHVLGAATSAGAHGPGQEEAPATFRRHGLLQRLGDCGLEVVDHGDIVNLRMQPDPEHPRLASADRVVAAAQTVAAHVEALLAAHPEDRILVLGGDCTIQLGVIAGAKAALNDSVGLAYIDLDCDLTSPVDGNGIADWMGVTHLLDAPDADPRLADLNGQAPLLTRDTLRLVAADLATPYEQNRLASLGITRFTSVEVKPILPVPCVRSPHGPTTWPSFRCTSTSTSSTRPSSPSRRSSAIPLASASTYSDTRGDGLMVRPNSRILTLCEVNPSRVRTSPRSLIASSDS